MDEAQLGRFRNLVELLRQLLEDVENNPKPPVEPPVEPPTDPEPPVEPPVEPPTSGEVRYPKGKGLMQPGARQRQLTDAEIKHPKITFCTLRDRWNKMEVSRGSYNFSYQLQQIKRCRAANKGYIFGVMTGGDCTPTWVSSNTVEVPDKDGGKTTMVVPWAVELPVRYKMLHERIVALEVAPGLKLGNDPFFEQVWCTGPTIPSQEMHLNGFERVPGWSAAKMEKAWKDHIDVMKEVYGPYKVSVVLSVSGQQAVQSYIGNVINYFKQAFGKERACFQHNSLGLQTTVTATHHAWLIRLHKEGYKVGSEQVQPGNVGGLIKFPEATWNVLYPGDEKDL